MSYNIRIPIYSQQDIIKTLQKYQNSDQVLEFTSELTGLSIDRLIEKLNELNQKDNDNDSYNM